MSGELLLIGSHQERLSNGGAGLLERNVFHRIKVPYGLCSKTYSS